MAVSANIVQSICDAIARDVKDLYEDLSLYFLMHEAGKMRDTVLLSEHDVASHPAGESARSILRKQTKNERSAFLGLAIASQNKMMGFKKIENILSLFSVNIDEFVDEREARSKIYQLVWHAIDLYEIRQTPALKGKFTSGPMIPKRTAVNMSKSNLQADSFACLMFALEGDLNLVNDLSQKRAVQSLSPVTHFKAEDYPYLIAMESCELAIQEILKNPPPREKFIAYARQISLDIGQAFDKESIKQWWQYSMPAQDMAWRGFEKEEILGAALNTSESPFVRSIAYLVEETIKINPHTLENLNKGYNAFLNPDEVLRMHEELIENTFEQAISEGMKDGSSQPFIDAANQQNESLTDGRILGWCAHALQNAGRAFERALKDGISADQAARMNFRQKDKEPTWDSLKELGKKIVDEKREGFAITMGHIAEICHNNPAFANVLDSIKITMNDPSYVQKLEAANDLNVIPSGPAMNNQPTPEPSAPAPKGPIPTAPALGPSLGGNNAARAAHLARQKQMMEKQKAESDQQSSETTDQ
ncbi:MAG: hypothetical protein AAGB32_05660 [Pseudomonadota bacterium]